MNQPQILMEELVGEARFPRTRHFVLLAQPPAQPRPSVLVERLIRRTDGAKAEVVRPGCQFAIQRPTISSASRKVLRRSVNSLRLDSIRLILLLEGRVPISGQEMRS